MKKFLLSLVSLFMLTTLALADLPLEAGMYYLYNPLSGKFLSRGNAWGTSAVVDDYGVAINVEVADQENGTYTLKGFDNNLPYGFDDWMFSDCSGGNADKARKYTLTSVEGGFTITNTNNGLPVYVYMNEADPGNVYRVAGNGTKGDNYTDDAQTVWQFKTPAERNEIVAAREAAEKTAAYTAAGLTEDDVVELGDPTELTFATGSTWEKTVVREQDGQPVTNDNGTEMWQATGNFTQAISNLDPGLYKVSIQAFYRNGGADECVERDATGYNTVLAYLEANGNKIQVKSWTTDKGEGNDPNDMGQAKSKFDAGKYLAEGYAYVGEDGILNLKVDNPAHIGNGWFIVSNVKYAQVYLDLLYADAVALAADENAVAVGKLLDAIEAYKTDRNTATLKLAMDQFQQDNADLELDVTSKVGTGTDKWVNAQSCPAGEFKIFSHKGIDLVQVFGVTGVGNVLTQEVDVENGLYNVALYATSHNAWDGKYGVNAAGAPTLQEDADDVAYVFASSGENSGSTWITARHNSGLLETEPELYDVNGIEVENGKISLGLALAQAAKTEWHCIQIASLKMVTTAKNAYSALAAEMQATRTIAVSLLADPYKTEGHTELQAAIEVAEAAIMSNRLNVTELEAAIAALQSAIDAFRQANYATFTGAYYIQAPSGKYMAAGHSWGTQGIVNEAGLDLTLATLENNTVTFDSQVANNETDHFLNKGLYMDGGAYGWIIEQVGADTYTISDGTQYIGVDGNDNLVLQNEEVAWKIIAADDVQAARLAALEAATAESGVDATFLIKGANFNRNDARNDGWTKWSQTEAEGTNLNISGGNNENNCAESYHAHFYVKQAIANAPKGVYKLTAQGFYRQDDEVVEDGAVFFIGDQTAAVPLKTGIEDNMSDASVSFTEGKYTIDSIEFVFSDGETFEVGVQNETAFHQWIIFDNFQLTYYGPAPAPTTYNVVVVEREHGTVVAEPTTAEAGATVTIKVTPDEGYMVDEVHVTYGDDQTIEWATLDMETLTGTIIMPAADVNVLFTFKEVEEKTYAAVKMTWVDYANPETSVGEVETAQAGYNKIANGEVGFGNTSWPCNWITYLQVDASEYKGAVKSAVLTFEGSGSTDSKRQTTWGVGYNSSEWSAEMTYSKADKSITLLNATQTGATKSSTVFEEYAFDITEAFANGKVATILIYETAAAGGYVKNPVVKVEMEPTAPELANPSFDENPSDVVTVTTQGYERNIPAESDQVAGMQPVTGWTPGFQTADDPGYTGGVFAYGSTNLLNNKVAAPAADPNGEDGVALGLAAVWAGVAQYTQEVTLPAGDYKFTYVVYNGANTGEVAKNLFGFIATDDTEYLSEKKSFTVGEWDAVEVLFTVDKETTGKISVGFIGSGGSGAAPHLFVDHVALTKVPGIDAAKAELQKTIEAAQAEAEKYVVGEGIFMYAESEIAPLTTAIATATDALNDAEATKESINTAKDVLTAFVEAFAPVATLPDAEQSYSIFNKQAQLYMTLSADGISIAEEAYGLKFEAAEGGKYYITDGTYYVGLVGTDNWSMTSDAAKKEALTVSVKVVEGVTYYSFAESKGLVGVDYPKKDNKGCWANKAAGDGDAVLWTIAEFEPIPVGIKGLAADDKKASIYDLSGRKVEKMVKGVYIVTGKKVSVK